MTPPPTLRELTGGRAPGVLARTIHRKQEGREPVCAKKGLLNGLSWHGEGPTLAPFLPIPDEVGARCAETSVPGESIARLDASW
jgi:hypothetical protein